MSSGSVRRSGRRDLTHSAALSVLIAALAAALRIGSASPAAQAPAPEFYPGKNVDIVGPYGTAPYHPAGSNPFLLGDPDKKQQNEPSCDVSPNNHQVVFCGVNSYSAVDRPDVSGEPWVGAAFSMDGGLTWKSHLHPGFRPKDPSAPAPLVPPLGLDTAADPVVRLVPGMGLFTFIAFNREGVGALKMGRWFERNTEGGFPYGWKDTVEIAKGTGSPGEPGRFLDKPATTVSLLPGSNTYNFVVPDPAPGEPGRTRIQRVPSGIVHVGYAVFTGNDQQDGTKIVYTRSTNYGDTWDPSATISESQSINQAPDIAVDQRTSRVVVVWRRFANPTSKQSDAIMAAISTDDGKSFGKAMVVSELCSFTQNTTSASFRTTTHPFITFDGTAFHAIWAERQGQCASPPTGFSRIVMSNLSFGGNSPRWSKASVVDSVSPSNRRGHEYQPAIVSAGKTILVSWLDTRNDVRVGGSFPDPTVDPYVNDYVFAGKTKVRRRGADVFAAEAAAGQSPTFGPPKQISRYLTGIFPGETVPRTLERNKVNARMFQSGKVPFQGDYMSAAAARFVLSNPVATPGEWVSSAGSDALQPTFHVAWTDNRLVRGDVSAGLAETSSTPYTPPPVSLYSETDPTTPRGPCVVAAAGTRDQTVFSARLTPALVLGTGSASKPTVFTDGSGTHTLLRSYSVIVQNTSNVAGSSRTVVLKIAPPATSGVVASFAKVTPEQPKIEELSPTVLQPRSSIARTVYVTAPLSATPPVVKIVLMENGVEIAATYLNPNPWIAPLDDPLDPNQRMTSEDQVDSIELHTPDILYRATSIGTPAIDDPAIDDPAIDDPAIDDPAIDDPAIDDPAIDDPAIDDPAIDDPAIDDPAIDDPAIDDPAIDDPAIDDPAIDDASVSASSLFDQDTETGANNTGQKLTQITWKVALKGNTTTSMTAKVFLNISDAQLAAIKAGIGPGKSQLLVSRRYRTSDVRGDGCAPVRVSSYQVINNVVDPVLTNNPAPPDLVNPTSSEPSFAIPPGDAVYLTFRVWGDVPGFRPNRVGTIVQSQPGPPASEPLDTDIPEDHTAPTLILPGAPDPKVTAEATGPDGAVVTYQAAASDDADGTVAVICSPASGSTFAIGTTPVQCSATDSAGNQATGTFSVIVTDTGAPVVTVPSSIVAEATSAAGAVVTYAASANDLVQGALTPTCSTASGSTFPLGTTTVTCSASDAAVPTPNVAVTTFTVTVVADAVGPTITNAVSPMQLWPPDGTMVPVTVSGEATDALSGMATISWSVTDEYRQVQPSGSFAATNGPFTFQIMLLRDRRGNDKDGRHYTINVTARDKAGNATAAKPVIINVHDQSGM